jgi:hypothetical protein
MTDRAFRNILIDNGIDPEIVRWNDTASDNAYFVNAVYGRYEFGYRERGTVFEPREFTSFSDVIAYLRERFAT